MVKVGIGVTSYNRPECLKECLENIYKYTDHTPLTVYVAKDTDEDRQGIAKRKNECLRALKDCDYIVLLDDDCHPIKEGWIDFCINEGQEHLLFMNDKLHRKVNNVMYYDCGGVFMFMTKSVVERVGAFNENFGIYGFEHAEYTNRITGQRKVYPTNIKLKEYLFAHDYSTPNHKSSITDEEKQKHVQNNWDKFFNEPIKSIYLPL